MYMGTWWTTVPSHKKSDTTGKVSMYDYILYTSMYVQGITSFWICFVFNSEAYFHDNKYTLYHHLQCLLTCL